LLLNIQQFSHLERVGGENKRGCRDCYVGECWDKRDFGMKKNEKKIFVLKKNRIFVAAILRIRHSG